MGPHTPNYDAMLYYGIAIGLTAIFIKGIIEGIKEHWL